jgi:hypothetical protein
MISKIHFVVASHPNAYSHPRTYLRHTLAYLHGLECDNRRDDAQMTRVRLLLARDRFREHDLGLRDSLRAILDPPRERPVGLLHAP